MYTQWTDFRPTRGVVPLCGQPERGSPGELGGLRGFLLYSAAMTTAPSNRDMTVAITVHQTGRAVSLLYRPSHHAAGTKPEFLQATHYRVVMPVRLSFDQLGLMASRLVSLVLAKRRPQPSLPKAVQYRRSDGVWLSAGPPEGGKGGEEPDQVWQQASSQAELPGDDVRYSLTPKGVSALSVAPRPLYGGSDAEYPSDPLPGLD